MDEAQTKEELRPVKKQRLAKLIIFSMLASLLNLALEKSEGAKGVSPARGEGCDS